MSEFSTSQNLTVNKKVDVHPLAVVDARAELGQGVVIGAGSVVGDGPDVGDGPLDSDHSSTPQDSPTWRYGEPNQDCSTVCSEAGLECNDGDWGITDEASFRLALETAGVDPDTECTHPEDPFRAHNHYGNQPTKHHPDDGPGKCQFANANQISTCDSKNVRYSRLCQCEVSVPPAVEE